MLLFYNIAIRLYCLTALLISPFSRKAKLWHAGRRGLLKKIEAAVSPDDRPVWIHCASLGEFEQVRPLMEKFRKNDPACKIVLTFFSPSGYEVRKNYDGADRVFYLPADIRKKAARFLDLVNPKMAVFVKYDFWHHYIDLLYKRGIPIYMVSANFRNDQVFFKWYGGRFRKMLHKFRHIFVQTPVSETLLKGIGATQVTVAGDIRFDRVASTARQAKDIPILKAFKLDKITFIGGSTWEKDEELIIPYINALPEESGINFILAPHLVHKPNIDRIAGLITKKAIRYSEATDENIAGHDVLLIDNIGLLASAYKYGDIGHVGGGFGKSVHNVLEATTFGIPVSVGPNHHRFPEIAELIGAGVVCVVRTKKDFDDFMNAFLNDSLFLRNTSETAKKFVSERIGATEIIFSKIAEQLK